MFRGFLGLASGVLAVAYPLLVLGALYAGGERWHILPRAETVMTPAYQADDMESVDDTLEIEDPRGPTIELE